MEWWVWCLLGFALLLAELATPGGFYLMFFGIGALFVALMRSAGISGPAWTQWVLFSVSSIALTAAFRRRFVERLSRTASVSDLDTLVGGRANAVEAIESGSMGRVSMRGTAWQARNAGADPIQAGEECNVEEVRGLVLVVRAAKAGGS